MNDIITLSQSFAGFLFSNQSADSLLTLRDCDKRALEKQGVGILIRGNMKTIELTRGKVVIVDDTDFDWLNQWNWYACKAKNAFYAQRTQGIFPFKKYIYMHRLIMNASDGFDVDHINGNKLDNRRSNLRLCNRSENMGNVRKHSDNTSGYKGVYWRTDKNKWCAVIKINYKTKYLGYFVDVKDAARAYDVAAKNYFGQFAQLNFPEVES